MGKSMTSNVVLIRLARVSEQKELEALQWRASLRNAGDREALLANADAIEIPIEQIAHGQVFVAEAAGLIVGVAALLPRQDGGSELEALFVEPDKWRHGLGRKLIDHCIEAARTNGSGALHVIGNPHAEGFYLACGFELLGSTQTRFGTGLLLRKIL
jgi:N-acetylglutamate synthase-like GNAT family acetyltransferase